MSDERETIQRNPESVAAWKRECAFLREQLAALAEQNEKYRKVIPHCVVGASGYAVEQLFIECLSLPDLDSPVLNRIRAEG